MLGGVQKGGTTALARHLARHPALALPMPKEAHVFDAADFDDDWGRAEIDARFAAHFADPAGGRICGDATPITVFHPVLVARAARYNPAMRWIVLLRDPVERAISQYFMERARGIETRGLLAAVLLERWRLRGRSHDWSAGSPLRVATYAARGRYAAQLDVLFRHFPREQVLLLRSRDFDAAPGEVLARVWAFLGVAPLPEPVDTAVRVFAGRYRPPSHWSPGRLALRWILRNECAALRAGYGIALEPGAPGPDGDASSRACPAGHAPSRSRARFHRR